MENKPRVLVVEDTVFNQVLTESLLKVWGYTPVITNSALEALNLMKGEKFNLIVLDLMMPDMDGFEFLTQKQKRKDNTPVIVISSLTETETINRALGLGAIDYIVKPFNSNELKAKLAGFFNP